MAENNAPRDDAVGTENTDDTITIQFLTEDGEPWMEADGTTQVEVEIPRAEYNLLVSGAEENGRTEEEELRAALIRSLEALVDEQQNSRSTDSAE